MSSPTPLLLLDTCMLLDIIRAPVRENIGTHDVAAILTLIARNSAAPQILNFAVTQQVIEEYKNHVDEVEKETRYLLDKFINQTNDMLSAVMAFNTGISLPAPLQMATQDIATSLRAIADGILQRCLTIPHTIDDSHLALGRVQQAKPPATRAKQSVKDCLIIVGVFRYVSAERATGVLGKAVFASSNTSDYHQGYRSLHPVLRAEFDSYGLGFASSWSAARYEIDRL